MKRSEMIAILQKSFIYHMNPDGPAETDEEMYSNILHDLEVVGMEYIDSNYEHGFEDEK